MRSLTSILALLISPALFVATLATTVQADDVPAPPAAPVATTAATPTPTPPAVPAGIRIGYVDLAKIAADSARGKAIQAQLKERQGALQGELDKKKQQLDKQRKSIEAQLPKLTPAQREAKTKAFQQKVEAAQKSAQEAEQTLYKLQDELATTLFKEVVQLAEGYGKANGLALVMVKKELLYLNDGVTAQDVTAELIKTLDAAPAPAGK